MTPDGMNPGGIPPHYQKPYPVGARVRVISDINQGGDLQENEPPYEDCLGTVVELCNEGWFTTRVQLDDGRFIWFDPTRELDRPGA